MQIEIISPRMSHPLGAPRSEGIHVSSVIRNIATLNKILKPDYLESLDLVNRSNEVWWDGLDDAAQLRMSLGLAWEHYYILNQLGESVVHQPGEMCVEGIYMTHDGEGLETILSERGEQQTVLVLHEVKLTYKSWNTIKNLAGQWMWLAQMKAYCKGLGTLLAYLHVFCVCGDYSYPMTPIKRVFRIRFTQLEVDDNWDLITGYVQHHRQQQIEDQMKDTQ